MKDTCLNRFLSRRHRLFIENDGRFYEIVYHKGVFFWQDRVTIKTILHNLLINHWEVNEIMGIKDIKQLVKGETRYSTLNCMGYGHGIIHGLFVKRKMKKQLNLVASVWSRVTFK